jgi:hypothetical protein
LRHQPAGCCDERRQRARSGARHAAVTVGVGADRAALAKKVECAGTLDPVSNFAGVTHKRFLSARAASPHYLLVVAACRLSARGFRIELAESTHSWRITMTYSRLAAATLAVLSVACAVGAAPVFAAEPAHCGKADALQIRGDVPAAISFDVYRQLRPLNAQRIALFQSAGEVKHLPDGLAVCEVADDGVDDPSAVLVALPQGKNAWWVSAANVQDAD